MSIGSDELRRHVDNDKKLHDKVMALARVLALKKARRVYHPALAEKAFRLHLGMPAAKAYSKEYGRGKKEWREVFTRADLDALASDYRAWFEAEHKLGNFESLLPAKYQNKATRKKAAAALEHADKQRNHSIGAPEKKPRKKAGKKASKKAAAPHKVTRKPAAKPHAKKSRKHGGTVPSGALKPHKGTARCSLCGEIHTKSAHWSHETAPKGGKPGGYKKKRGLAERRTGS